MDPVSLILMASATKVVQEAAKTISESLFKETKVALKRKRRKSPQTLELNADAISPETANRIIQTLKAAAPTPSDVLTVSREMVRTGDEAMRAESPKQRELGAIALAISPQAVFKDARQRMNLVFKVNLAVAIVLAIILLSGLAGAIYSGIFMRSNLWASIFGGVSAADVISLMVFKPLTAINSALIGTQRLEMIQLRLSQQLQACEEHQQLQQRIDCQTLVWDTIQKELSLLSDTRTMKPKGQ